MQIDSPICNNATVCSRHGKILSYPGVAEKCINVLAYEQMSPAKMLLELESPFRNQSIMLSNRCKCPADGQQ